MSTIPPRCQAVPLTAITFSKEWSLHPWDSQIISDNLLLSFERLGILHKPILLAKDNGYYDILCGFKRLLFALSNTPEQYVECLVFSKDTEATILLETVLADQQLSHPLTLAEKARFIEICTRFLTPQDIVAVYLERLQLRRKVSTLSEMSNILQQDPIIIAEIHADRLQERMVVELLRLPEKSDRVVLAQIFCDLAMGDGKQKRFFTLIRDLAFRQNTSIAEYLKTPAIADILNHSVLNVPQKVHHLNNYLQQQLYPKSSQAEEEFTRLVREMGLPSQCVMSHSPSFEKDDITLSITFKNMADCAKMVPQINTLLLVSNYLR